MHFAYIGPVGANFILACKLFALQVLVSLPICLLMNNISGKEK